MLNSDVDHFLRESPIRDLVCLAINRLLVAWPHLTPCARTEILDGIHRFLNIVESSHETEKNSM